MKRAATALVPLLAASAVVGCGGRSASGTLAFSVSGNGVSPRVLSDVRRTVERQAPAICAALEAPCRFAVAVEVYPSQQTFDRRVLNPAMRGYRAVSSEGRIQLVSPAVGGTPALSYTDGLMIAAHEFAHLVLDELNPDLPDWLDEGAAVFFGPARGRALYDRACRTGAVLETPAYSRLTQHYADVRGADLFAYTLVASIAEHAGTDRLLALLRAAPAGRPPADLDPRATEHAWHGYLVRRCGESAQLPASHRAPQTRRRSRVRG